MDARHPNRCQCPVFCKAKVLLEALLSKHRALRLCMTTPPQAPTIRNFAPIPFEGSCAFALLFHIRNFATHNLRS
jgi:hypothetical protein